MRFVSAVFFPLVLCCNIFAAGDFKVTPDVPLDSLSISAGTNGYIVVWRDLRNSSSPQMRGVFVSTTGAVTTDFGISNTTGQPLAIPVQRATTAFDGNNFFTVWADNRSSGSGVRGALINSAGAVVGGADLLIATLSQTSNVNPLAVFTGTDYVVAWQDTPQSSGSAGPQIYFTRVSLSGVAGTVQTLPASPFSTSTSLSLEFLAATPANKGSEVLVVYQDLASAPNVTLGTRIAVDNTFLNPSTLLFKRDFSSSGFGVPIAAAFDGVQYLILSSYSAQIDSTVWLTRFRTDGSVVRPSGSFAEVGQGTTGLTEDAFPRAIFNGTTEFMFVRNDFASPTALHIFLERVGTDGTNSDPNPYLADSATQGILNGGVAASIGTQYLVAWMDGRRFTQQPAGQGDVYGFLIDDVKNPGDTTVPFLRAVAKANPLVGDPPLTVNFSAGGSTGFSDTLVWNFGDGSTSTTTSDVSHIYQNAGEYIAVLTLTRAGFGLRDFARILPGGNLLGGGGGAPQTVGGSLGPVSNGVNADVFANSLGVVLDFAKSNDDSIRFSGFADPSSLPISLAHLTASLTIAGQTYSMTADANGVFTQVNGPPRISFALSNFSGNFVFSVNAASLASVFAPLGATNTTVGKPGSSIVVPVTFALGDVLYNANITTNYTATAGKSGKLLYQFGTTGSSDQGYMHIFGAGAAESGNAPNRVDAFAVSGNFGPGGSTGLTKADSGNWTFTIGNYVESIPVTSLTIGSKSTIYSFKAPKSKVGIQSLGYDTSNGRFLIEYKLVPAEGNTPSGMPVSTTTIARADMAFSVDLAVANGPDFQAAAFARLVRSKAGSKKWKLR
jgi:PKD repeat protein